MLAALTASILDGSQAAGASHSHKSTAALPVFGAAVLHINSASTTLCLALATDCFSDTHRPPVSLSRANCMTKTDPKRAEKHKSDLFPEERG